MLIHCLPAHGILVSSKAYDNSLSHDAMARCVSSRRKTSISIFLYTGGCETAEAHVLQDKADRIILVEAATHLRKTSAAVLHLWDGAQ